ncbi:MAG: HesA/MoeB/ThiF family protein [Anaerolineae bacterium]
MEPLVYDRSVRIPGFDLAALRQAKIVVVGCGGLGSECSHGLVRKGVGEIHLLDYDSVEVSNLARQRFYPEDVGKNKALCLARNLVVEATAPTVIVGRAMAFQEALEAGISMRCTAAIVGVDNNLTRIHAAEYFRSRRIPAVFAAVDDTATRGYVFVQESRPETACFLCLFPDAQEDTATHGCAGASIEILKVVAGFVLYAVDSLIMARSRSWNYVQLHLDTGDALHYQIAQRSDCPVCAGRGAPHKYVAI